MCAHVRRALSNLNSGVGQAPSPPPLWELGFQNFCLFVVSERLAVGGISDTLLV